MHIMKLHMYALKGNHMTELIRVSKAAERLGYTRQQIYRMIEGGVIQVQKIDGVTFVVADNIGELSKPRKVGRPANKAKV